MTPYFEGDAADQDAVVFGTERGGGARQWRLQKGGGGRDLSIRAGVLHGMNDGSILAIVASATTPTEEAIGFVETFEVDTAASRLRPVEFDGKPGLEVARLPRIAWARLVQRNFALGLSVARPTVGDDESPENAAAARRLIAAIEAAESDNLSITW